MYRRNDVLGAVKAACHDKRIESHCSKGSGNHKAWWKLLAVHYCYMYTRGCNLQGTKGLSFSSENVHKVRFQLNTNSENSIEKHVGGPIMMPWRWIYMHESCHWWVFTKFVQWKYFTWCKVPSAFVIAFADTRF